MIKEAIGMADTVEEAKEMALAELNAPLDADVQIDVIAIPKKKTLGIFGGSQAKVKASIEVADVAPSVSKKQPKSAKKAEKSETTKPVKKAVETTKSQNAEVSATDENVKMTPASDVDKNSPEGKAVVYLQNVLEKIGCDNIEITVNDIEGGTQINLTGEGLGIIIGHRGETLDAMQYLVSLAANAGVSGYHRIVLNTGDFRKKREQTLISLAKRMCDQAINSGKCRTLEPMNPYERRIIHTTVQQIDGVTSTSFGEGAGRRVVIAPEGKEPRPRMDYKNNFRGSNRSGHFDRNDRTNSNSRPQREAYKPQVNPDKAPVKDADAMPLYGRIDK